MKTRVVVTKEDIRHGRPYQADSCPIALSLRRIKGLDLAIVETNSAECGYWITRMSKKARQFVRDFDEGNPVKPSVFYFNWGKMLP